MAKIAYNSQKDSFRRPSKLAVFSSSVLFLFFMFYLILIFFFFFKEKIGENKGKKKWKLWRSASEGFGSTVKRSNATESEPSVASLVADEAFAAAMAAVARAQPKDFVIVKKEWAAIRIQAVFRGFLVLFFPNF